MITPPDQIYSVGEAANILRVSERQVHRYLSTGVLRGSRTSGAWRITALDLWRHVGIADEMLAEWRRFCLEYAAASQSSKNNDLP